MSRSKEEEMLFKHYMDLIDFSYQRMVPAYSNFAGFLELRVAMQALEAYYGRDGIYEGVQYRIYGGYKEAERKMFCFTSSEQVFSVSESDFPIQCIRFVPANKKFGEALSHRDYLGTILGLGINRDQIGDILVRQDDIFHASYAYVFCRSDKAEMLLDIRRIRHTTVEAEPVDFSLTSWEPSFREIVGSVSSFRLDVILAFSLKMSRSQVLSLIQAGSVMLNGKICTENAKSLEEGDVFSVRGYGKYIYENMISRSKKGKYQVKIKQYI